ncbi:MAG TPA: hypothetical protein VLT59_06415, partial [Steroidobacteraceae bacterium]|nr:hypothetical protein [Steroidobacteraceae bacterium]
VPAFDEDVAATVDPATGLTVMLPGAQRSTVRNRLLSVERVNGLEPRPAQGGEKAAIKALELLMSRDNPPQELVFETLVELGDWSITDRKPNDAAAYYARAWNLLDPDDPRLAVLRDPRVLVFKPPEAAVRSRRKWEGEIPPREIDFTLTVYPDGSTADVVVATEDAPAGQVGQLRRALEAAIFSPRIESGVPVATQEHRVTQVWFELDDEAMKQSSNESSRRRL